MKVFEVKRRAGHRLQPQEEAIKTSIQALLDKLSTKPPLDSNSVRSIQFQVQTLQDLDRLDPLLPIRHLTIEDDSALNAINTILNEQHKGIKALTETLIKDAEDLEIMRYGFEL